MEFKIVFKDKDAFEYSLPFRVYSTDIASRWFDVLKEQCQRDGSIWETDRMYDFPDGIWTEEKLVQELNDCIKIINKVTPVIHHQAYVGMPQEQLNHLHHYFETLRGGIKSPGAYWLMCDEECAEALVRYNIIIHRAEEFYRNVGQTNQPRIVCTFNDIRRHDLLQQDYEFFTFHRSFGEVYINYCEVGKPIFDVYKDGDSVVGDDNIRPLRYYAADFTAYFYDRDPDLVTRFVNGMDQWWDQNEQHLLDLGFVKNDPRNAMGNIPVAKLISNETEDDIVSSLTRFNIMDRVEIL